MTLRLIHCLLLVLALGLPGCAHHGQKRPPKAQAARPSKTVPVMVGTVSLVNEEQKFVMIDSGSGASPTPGVGLKIEGPVGATPVELLAGDVHHRPFTVADIVSGVPKVGDKVFEERTTIPRATAVKP